MIFEQSGWRWKPVALFGALTLVVVALVMASPLSAGRPSLLQSNVFGGSYDAVYSDAFALHNVHPHVGDWVVAVARKFRGNLHGLVVPHFWSPLEQGSMLFLLAGVPLGLGWLPGHRKRDGLFVGVAAMVLVLLLFLLAVYTVWEFRGVRLLLIAEPFVAVLWSVQLHQLLQQRRAGQHAREFAVALVAVIGLSWVHQVFRTEPGINEQSARDTAFLESLGLDDRRLLVSPYRVSLDYVQKHYPLQWAFLPTNRATLRLLNERYPIGAVILPIGGHADWLPGDLQLQPSDVAQIGLTGQGETSYRGITFAVFKR
jgi:hypothetical protein